MSALKLISVKYSERVDKPKEWTLDGLTLGPINLIVGTNATGKTRTLNIIGNFAKMFVPQPNQPRFRPGNANYDLLFEKYGERLRYILMIENGKVMREEFYIGSDRLLNRGPSGEGDIYAEEEKKAIRFKPPVDELAAVIRRDSIQHPFLEQLHDWALAVRHYTFGTPLGKDHLAVFVKDAPDADERDANQVIGIFRKAERDYGTTFTDAVKQDMTRMGYNIEQVLLSNMESIKVIKGGIPAELQGICVKESNIDGIIDQNEISQGMFRALSIIIQVNYSQLTHSADCILIDDIGEGLDFDRSTRLIDLLREKAKISLFQLIMTTNDRFVMNSIPLEEWAVLQRQGGHVQVRNYENSRELFEEFKFTGLGNFSFLELDFAKDYDSKETTINE